MDALRAGATPEEVFAATHIDPWFVDQLLLINEIAAEVTGAVELTPEVLRKAKRHGFSDVQIGKIRGMTADVVRGVRHALGIRPVYKTVDTCAAEFAAATPYHYSSYDEETEVRPRERPAVIILGSGPNRIGQGIEFDYSCVHASMALGQGEGGAGYETVMVNCNPETVSTDYDTSDRLYFEPLTLEDVLEIVHAEQQAGPIAGVICQLGGQTPLGLAQGLEDNGVPIVGTSPAAIHLAEERGAFGRVLRRGGAARAQARHRDVVRRGPGDRRRDRLPGPGAAVLRPRWPRHGDRLRRRGARGLHRAARPRSSPEHPVLVDRFIDDAVEIDVDALYDGEELFLGGVMEHIEEAGIHSGDSSCALPPITLGDSEIQRIRDGHRGDRPRRGGPRADQHPVRPRLRHPLRPRGQPARVAGRCRSSPRRPRPRSPRRRPGSCSARRSPACGRPGLLPATGDGGNLPADQPIAVKEAVMPFNRFRTPDGRQVDTVLGPEMKSTGEVMGLDANFGQAFAKSQAAAYGSLPTSGRVFVSMANRDKRTMIFPIKVLADMGFEILATQGTAEALRRNGVQATVVRKHFEGPGEGDRADHRPADPRRRHRPGRQHPARLAPAAARRASTATRSAPRRSWPTSRASRPSRASARRSRGSRRRSAARSGCGRCRTGSPVAGRTYSGLFDHGFVRMDPERAHRVGFRAVRAARPMLAGGVRRAGARSGDGADVPQRARARRRLRQERRRHRRAGRARLRARRGRHRHRPAQPGNDTPRLFRLTADRAVVNRMGFNNDGAEAVARRLANRVMGGFAPRRRPVLGINIGKTKVVPEDDEAAVLDDYGLSARLLAPHADYLVVNVSSPNTPGLRTLQSVEKLQPLLEHVRRTADRAVPDRRVPLLVKIAPDLADEDVLAVADLATAIGLDGIIATNTTISRDGLLSSPAAGGRRPGRVACPGRRSPSGRWRCCGCCAAGSATA